MDAELVTFGTAGLGLLASGLAIAISGYIANRTIAAREQVRTVPADRWRSETPARMPTRRPIPREALPRMR
jgi:hypothetical protein